MDPLDQEQHRRKSSKLLADAEAHRAARQVGHMSLFERMRKRLGRSRQKTNGAAGEPPQHREDRRP